MRRARTREPDPSPPGVRVPAGPFIYWSILVYGSLRDPLYTGLSPGVRVPTGPFLYVQYPGVRVPTGPFLYTNDPVYGSLRDPLYTRFDPVYGSLRDPFILDLTRCTGPYGTLNIRNCGPGRGTPSRTCGTACL